MAGVDGLLERFPRAFRIPLSGEQHAEIERCPRCGVGVPGAGSLAKCGHGDVEAVMAGCSRQSDRAKFDRASVRGDHVPCLVGYRVPLL